jgi:hypothetical protein
MQAAANSVMYNAVLSRRTGGEAEKNETADPVRSA